MKSNFIAITLTVLFVSGSSAQTLQDVFVRQQSVVAASLSPMAMVEMMERQLSDQFKGAASALARQSTAKLIKDGQTVGYGTIINGRSDEFSYLLCPADVISAPKFIIQTQDGRLQRPVAGAPIQLLSREDNLILIRISHVEKIISIKSNLNQSSIGSFVGVLAKDQRWKTGSVTNSNRTAYTGIDPGTQRALTKHWKRIGLKVNAKRSGYPEIIETDIAIDPSEAGAPVFDREGKWHGIAIARADQHSTLVIPAKRVSALVAEFEISHHK